MADESQVEAAIVSFLGGVLYPNGTGQPSAITAPVNVERGWPTEANVRSAVLAGMVLVRVHGVKGLSSDHTRYPRTWIDQPVPSATLVATLGGGPTGLLDSGGNPVLGADSNPILLSEPISNPFQLDFSGTPAPGQFVGVVYSEIGYAYSVGVSDTLETIATAVASQIPGATVSGATVQLLFTAAYPTATVQQSGPSMVEAARETQQFHVAVWAPSPALRDAALQLIHSNSAYTYRLALPDGSFATLMDIQNTGPDDAPGRAGEWRRDLRLNYDYPVTLVGTYPPVVNTILEIN